MIRNKQQQVPIDVMKPYKQLTPFLLVCLLSGCATWAQHGVTAGQSNKFRIALMPIEVTAEIDKVSDIMTSPPPITDKQKFIQEQLQSVSKQLTDTLLSKLNASGHIESIPVEPVLASAVTAGPQAWSADKLAKLKIDSDAQAVLLVKLSGYGHIKKKWLVYLLGSGVVEGVVQGVAAAKLTGNTWVGVALALEEFGQESLMWGGGSYLFNQHYSPVTLEAELISTTDAKTLWDDTVFVSIDNKAIEALPEADRSKKEIQLNLTAKKALDELTSDLDDTAKSNLNIRTEQHPRSPLPR